MACSRRLGDMASDDSHGRAELRQRDEPELEGFVFIPSMMLGAECTLRCPSEFHGPLGCSVVWR